MEKEVDLFSERTEKAVVRALVVGATLALSYILIKQLTGKKHHKKVKPQRYHIVRENGNGEEAVMVEPKAPGIVSHIGTILASQATAFLLEMAKEKLSEYLHSQVQKKNVDENS